ncbi:caspase family protein [Methylococcus sp. EFPC2]|uniref:caspase family protein n=1 Tax=Methylococcus sp. EFPC2 TaxID=2812648 RepID=UPI0019686B4C|nr:caspase family protein [Methylococcus sp. EFPC2]QSA96411.1 caspase family protein [Methylococcus sp. EFPC2]
MPNYRFRPRALVVAVSGALLAACAGNVSKEDLARATEGYVVEDTNKLFVVDCLLPGQVRKLGAQMTYLSARRPIRTTAADCEVRGGEYVAYDRANYASALKIWLPKAQEGDASAQLYVGEIFEKGLGQQTDYQAAAQWYKKAADQGNSQAQLNLGALYEKGLGVGKDPAAALKWYRKASGLENADLQFTSAIDATRTAQAEDQSGEIAALRQEAERSRQEAEQLRGQLSGARQQVLEQQEALRRAQDELEESRKALQREKSSSTGADDTALRRLEEQLRQKEANLRAQQAKVSEMSASLNKERQAVRRELESAKAQSARPALAAQAPAESPTEVARKRLAEAENQLNDKIDAYQKQSGELTEWLTQSGKTGADPAQLRTRIEERKKSLQAQAREIAALKDKAEQQESKLADLEKREPTLLAGGPNIEILEPAVTLTRGVPSIRINRDDPRRELVGKIDAPAGLSSLLINDKPQTLDASGVFRAALDLGSADAPVRIVAIDKKNKRADLTVNLVADMPVQAEVYPGGKTGGALGKGDAEFGEFYAIVIGNAEYGAFPALRTPVNDAKSVDLILRERYGFKTKLLINANRHAIMTTLNELNKKLTERDNLLIYYAGHGEIDKATQNAYWLPTDAEAGNPANWISSRSITEFLSIMPARHIMVVADSCYSGALAGSAVAKLPEGMDEAKRAKWLKAMTNRKARTVLTSGGVQPVMDEGGGDHSVFAKAFLAVLRSNQRVLEDYDVFRNVANQVSGSAGRAGFAQSPQYAPLQHAGHEGSPFFFVPQG